MIPCILRVAVVVSLGSAASAQALAVDEPTYYKDNRARFDDYVFRTYTDPSRLAWLLVDSATEHWSRAPRQWDYSAESYGMRIASGWGRRIVRNTALLGFETMLHEDSRYRPSRKTGIPARVWFAVSHSVLAYKPDGSVEPIYGKLAAGMVASATSSTWHPQAVNAATLLGGAGQCALDRAGSNLMTEFEPDLKRFALKTWANIRGR